MQSRSLLGIAAFAVMAGGCAQSGPLDWDYAGYAAVSVGDRDRAVSHTAALSPDENTAPAFPESPDLASLLQYAVQNHPLLQLAAYDVDASDGRLTQAGRYPNPSFAFEAEALGADDGSGGESTYLIEQTIPTAGKRRKARDVAESDRDIARARFRAEEFRVATDVRIAYIGALAAQERVRAYRELYSLSTEVYESVLARVEVGAATEPDRLRAQIAQRQAEILIRQAESDEKLARSSLGNAVGIALTDDRQVQGDLYRFPEAIEETVALDAALGFNARALESEVQIDRARRRHALARANASPDVTAAIGPRYSDIDNETTLDVGVGVEIPLFDRNQGDIRAAQAERFGAAAAAAAVRIGIRDDVARAWSQYRTSMETAAAYRDSVLPDAEQTLALATEAYRSGKTDYLRLLDAQQIVVESRITFIDAVQRLHESVALLDGLMQTDTPWRQIEVQSQ